MTGDEGLLGLSCRKTRGRGGAGVQKLCDGSVGPCVSALCPARSHVGWAGAGTFWAMSSLARGPCRSSAES